MWNALDGNEVKIMMQITLVAQAIETESQELELDLSSLGAVNTMFAALFR